ncbi:hypothetical protein M6D81_16230 [Paenibacillus sp. J5C_2022]|uniref:hypothetical protein n=1 Tax=Paenibacillus sp. J5C2022 TaxID=2977129 RepID=UPI0021D2D48A|nr:hypothetical protein [Paenibacillus sp. J5C2022]MCU6710248.1 hypothetical protein [Paenibacillus sp. J5C2022]
MKSIWQYCGGLGSGTVNALVVPLESNRQHYQRISRAAGEQSAASSTHKSCRRRAINNNVCALALPLA